MSTWAPRDSLCSIAWISIHPASSRAPRSAPSKVAGRVVALGVVVDVEPVVEVVPDLSLGGRPVVVVAEALVFVPPLWIAFNQFPGAISSATVIGSNTDQAITVSGSVSGPEFTESYGDALESAGYTQESTFESGDTINRVYMDDAWTIGVVYFGDASENQVTVSIYSSS